MSEEAQYSIADPGALTVHVGASSGTALCVNYTTALAWPTEGEATFGSGGTIQFGGSIYGTSCNTVYVNNSTIVVSGQTGAGSPVWNITSGGFGYIYGSNGTNGFVHPSTPEQIAEMQRLQEKQQAQWKREERRREKAEIKAEKLLREIVGRKMFDLYKQRGFFEVIGDTGRRYRFRKQQRVQIMAENFGDKVEYELCVINGGAVYVPPSDMLITLMLLVQSGEDGEKMLHEKGNRRAA